MPAAPAMLRGTSVGSPECACRKLPDQAHLAVDAAARRLPANNVTLLPAIEVLRA